MKILFRKILSFPEDGATSFLLVFHEKYKIMLDCGINADFDLDKYRAMAD